MIKNYLCTKDSFFIYERRDDISQWRIGEQQSP